MSAPDDRYKAMTFDHPGMVPVGVGILPAAWIKHREALEAIVAEHPGIFGEVNPGERDFDAVGGTYAEGEHVDAWNCVWSNVHHGCESFVTGHPIPRREMVREYKAPEPGAGTPHGFMFLRLTYLRGYEEMMIDFAEEPPELQMLIDLVLHYSLGEVQRMLQSPPGMLYFGDDLGLQDALPINPTKWRQYLKPCYMSIFGLCRDVGTRIYMHTDGHIVPIIADLIECGVDILNPQIGANGLQNLARECKGKICVDLDLDRQKFPFLTPDQIDAHVEEAVEVLGAPEGGLMLKAEIGPDVPLENVAAILDALEKHRMRFS